MHLIIIITPWETTVKLRSCVIKKSSAHREKYTGAPGEGE